MKEKLYSLSPHFIQNLFISVFNLFAYQKRYGGRYKLFRNDFKKNRNLTRAALLDLQETRFSKFIQKSKSDSEFYYNIYKDIPNIQELENIEQLPIIDKEILRANIADIITHSKEKLIISKTGGTTGKSLEVKYRPVNMQERFAMLDDFRSRFGYQLGKKTAWFSGKSLLTSKDIKKNRFWKTDYLYKVRYYSTFHVKQDYLPYYINDLLKFEPKFMVGFPSTMLEIAEYGLKHDYDFPSGVIKAIFPTAESVTPLMRKKIESFFKTKMYDQYASSEGAPFIFECVQNKLHLELQSGVFEVLDVDNRPVQSGRLVVTSFTTEGTPLIRYDIGDSVILEDPKKICSCGNNNPMIKQINGRVDDYIFSPETGKINLGNISNATKGTKGIRNFQVIQNELQSIIVYLVVDRKIYNKQSEKTFLHNWRERIGTKMHIKFVYKELIEVEASGKYRMVKNNIKKLIDAQA